VRRFAALFDELDASTATNDKLAALQRYFAAAPAADAAWAVYFLAGGRPRRVVPTALLRATACRCAGIDDWLFDACYQAVGDLAETIAHLLPPPAAASDEGLAHWVEARLLPLRGLDPAAQQARLAAAFDELDAPGRFLFVKLIGGGFRVGVSRLLVQRALAAQAGLDPKVVAERMMGYTEARATPSAARFEALRAAPLAAPAGAESSAAGPPSTGPGANVAPGGGQPFPFFLAHPLAGEPATLGPVDGWLLEWKFDGVRAQLVWRDGRAWIWTRGEELVTERFPEVAAAAARLPDGTLLDGELLVWPAGAAAPAPFQRLQQRIGRKTLTRRILADSPVVFVAYDLLQHQGADQRALPIEARRAALEALLAAPDTPHAPEVPDAPHAPQASNTPTAPDPPDPAAVLRLSPRLDAADWTQPAALRAMARARGFEGLMLKQRGSRYGSGRTKSEGTWWKWKVDPFAVDAVLVYAQAGHGRRAGLYTDYTFAVWSRPPRDAAEAAAVVQAIERREPAPPRDAAALQLLPFAKAYSGLADAELAAVDRVIRATTLEKFGPVRSVKPTLVFEIGFESIGTSPRHKSGIAVRFPRMLRLRHDKPLHEADSIETLRALIGGRADAAC
jgi:DNA ligase-1